MSNTPSSLDDVDPGACPDTDDVLFDQQHVLKQRLQDIEVAAKVGTPTGVPDNVHANSIETLAVALEHSDVSEIDEELELWEYWRVVHTARQDDGFVTGDEPRDVLVVVPET